MVILTKGGDAAPVGSAIVPLRISYYLAAFLSRFHQKQVHFEQFWLKRAAIYFAICSALQPQQEIWSAVWRWLLGRSVFDGRILICY